MVFNNHIDKTFFCLLQIWFVSVTGLINDSITDSVNMVCPGIYYDSVQNAFHNRILACSFNNHKCRVQNSGFTYSVDNPSKSFPNNSFNPSIGPGYIYGFNEGTFQINIPRGLYTNIKNFNIYITMAIYSESRNKSDFGLFDTQQRFSVEIPSSSYKWDMINIIYDLTNSEMNSGFTFALHTKNVFTRFDDICIYQICKENYNFNAVSNQCEENGCLTKNCQYSCNMKSGKPKCSCPTGYKLSSDNISCFQDLCLSKYCEYQCSVVSGIATCSCPAGFILHTDKISCLQVPTAVSSTSFTIIIPEFSIKKVIVAYYIILVKLSSPALPTRTSTSYTWAEIFNHKDNMYIVGVLDARKKIKSFIVGEGSISNPALQTGAAYTTFVRGIAIDNSTLTSSYSSIVVTKHLTTKFPATTQAPATTKQSSTTTQPPATRKQSPTTTQAPASQKQSPTTTQPPATTKQSSTSAKQSPTTTQSPATTKQSTSIKQSSTTTQAPATTKKSSTSTKQSPTTTQAPATTKQSSTSTKKYPTSTQPPATTKQSSTSTKKYPTSTQPPATTKQSPTTTQPPVSTKKSPTTTKKSPTSTKKSPTNTKESPNSTKQSLTTKI
ncbi:uncharacterized protein LOC101240402 isoform X4 [Hydra vulgaris]|uniref:Uncharacterized protein LOC101240402 isoform X4 n=1 Tax=Hydra vulgaris TaxID=6087 RepID=A0ABM4BQX3_HYDVU